MDMIQVQETTAVVSEQYHPIINSPNSKYVLVAQRFACGPGGLFTVETMSPAGFGETIPQLCWLRTRVFAFVISYHTYIHECTIYIAYSYTTRNSALRTLSHCLFGTRRNIGQAVDICFTEALVVNTIGSAWYLETNASSI